MRDGRRTSMEGERLSTNSVGIVSNGSRPISQTSSGMESVGSFQTVKHRDKPKLQVFINIFLIIYCFLYDLLIIYFLTETIDKIFTNKI